MNGEIRFRDLASPRVALVATSKRIEDRTTAFPLIKGERGWRFPRAVAGRLRAARERAKAELQTPLLLLDRVGAVIFHEVSNQRLHLIVGDGRAVFDLHFLHARRLGGTGEAWLRGNVVGGMADEAAAVDDLRTRTGLEFRGFRRQENPQFRRASFFRRPRKTKPAAFRDRRRKRCLSP